MDKTFFSKLSEESLCNLSYKLNAYCKKEMWEAANHGLTSATVVYVPFKDHVVAKVVNELIAEGFSIYIDSRNYKLNISWSEE